MNKMNIESLKKGIFGLIIGINISVFILYICNRRLYIVFSDFELYYWASSIPSFINYYIYLLLSSTYNYRLLLEINPGFLTLKLLLCVFSITSLIFAAILINKRLKMYENTYAGIKFIKISNYLWAFIWSILFLIDFLINFFIDFSIGSTTSTCICQLYIWGAILGLYLFQLVYFWYWYKPGRRINIDEIIEFTSGIIFAISGFSIPVKQIITSESIYPLYLELFSLSDLILCLILILCIFYIIEVFFTGENQKNLSLFHLIIFIILWYIFIMIILLLEYIFSNSIIKIFY